MDNLTYEELIQIVVALDNEACSGRCTKPQEMRDLKWKVFRIAGAVLKRDQHDAELAERMEMAGDYDGRYSL